jgi:hypothetical protein
MKMNNESYDESYDENENALPGFSDNNGTNSQLHDPPNVCK